MIRVKRGVKADLPTLWPGEPGMCLDTGEFYVGSNHGNVRINPWITPEAFGAKGDGVTDDTVAIAAADAVGGNIVFSDTTYLVGDDLTISDETNLVIPEGGGLSISSGKTLTINGHVDAGPYQIFTGDGTITYGSGIFIRYYQWDNTTGDMLIIGPNAVTQGAYIWVGDNYTAEYGWHAFEDETKITNHNDNGYASYDCMPTMQGTGPYNHLVGYQSRPIYNSSGDLVNYLTAFDSFPVHSGTGRVIAAHGLRVRDLGGVGPITTDYGIKIEEIWRGDTNYAIYQSSTTKSYFGGNVGFGTEAPLSPVHVYHATSPAIRLSFANEWGASGLYQYNDGNVYGILSLLGTDYERLVGNNYGGDNALALINGTGPISASPNGLTTPTLLVASTTPYFRAGTTDGADNSYLTLAGGGGDSVLRGASINLFGNEHAQKGSVAIIAGQGDGATWGEIDFYGNATPLRLVRIRANGSISVRNGTSPTDTSTNYFHLWSADTTNEKAVPNFKTGDGIEVTLNQDVSTDASPTFEGVKISNAQVIGRCVEDIGFGITPNTGDADTDTLITILVAAMTTHGLISTKKRGWGRIKGASTLTAGGVATKVGAGTIAAVSTLSATGAIT